jgi:hypothetical protein
MAVRSTKAPSSRPRSKSIAKAVEMVPVQVKPAAKEALNLVDQVATGAAKVSTAVKRRTGTTVHPAKPSGPRSRAETAAKAVELATSAPQTAIKEAVKLVDTASHGTADAASAVTAIAARSIKSAGPRARPNVAAKTALASVPTKALVDEAVNVVDEVRKSATAVTESAKTETAYAIDTYKDVATETLDSTEEIVKAASDLVAGATEIHRMIWSSMQRALYSAVEIPAQFATCTSIADLAQTQRDMMRRGFNDWLNISQEILMANRRIMDRAIHTLEPR